MVPYTTNTHRYLIKTIKGLNAANNRKVSIFIQLVITEFRKWPISRQVAGYHRFTLGCVIYRGFSRAMHESLSVHQTMSTYALL